MTTNNPLLDFTDLPRFAEIKPEHVTPAIDHLLQIAQSVVDQVTAPHVGADWEHLVEPLDDATEKLSRAWGAVGHMNAVVDTPELRAAYNENQPKLTEFWTALSQNLALYEKYKALHNSAAFGLLPPARKKIIENALRDFRLGGAELSDKDKERFAEIQERQSVLSTKFSENVLDTTNAFALFVEEEAELRGLPEDVKTAARDAAAKDEKPGWKFTLHFPSYFPVLQYADNRELRRKLYHAHATRASELGNPDWDNTALINEMLALRAEEAKLLGYRNFAELSLVPKMAPSPEKVIEFLEDLARRARPFAEQDLKELREFAQLKLSMPHLEAWDIAYVSEKLREQRYAFSEQEVKQYFPEAKVLEGLFRVIETLFSVKLKPDQAPVWHEDARFFRIEKEGRLIGQFYLDLYARNGKRGGAWMDDARGRRVAHGTTQTPVAYLTCNFSSPVAGKPALFTHDEVSTLFHEFGHGLHHMLTRIGDLGVAGINGVEWDAVELPSQFLENFCWEWDVLSHMTAHVDTIETNAGTSTGAPLPRALFDKMLAAKNFQSGWQTLRQVAFSLFDMHLHYDFDVHGTQTATEMVLETLDRINVFPSPRFSRIPHSFTHIFAGGYAAGYYSYKWAEVLSADAYSLFEETGVLNPDTGQRFLQEILQVGGSRPALESFKAFRGRDPNIDALLRHQGMIEATT